MEMKGPTKKELAPGEGQKVLDLLDEISVICGGVAVQPQIKLLIEALKGYPNAEQLQQSVLDDIAKTIGMSFATMANTLEQQISTPEGQAEMKAKLMAQMQEGKPMGTENPMKAEDPMKAE